MRTVDMLLQRLEIGDAGGEHEGDLAVEKHGLSGEREKRLGDRGEAHRPVETAPAEQRDLVADLAADDAVAVIFDLVEPARSCGDLAFERGELGRDEVRT